MKGLTRCLVAITLAVLAPQVVIAGCVVDDQLKNYLTEKCKCPNVRVLAFNHNEPNRPWRASFWNGTDLTDIKKDLLLDVNQKPRLSLGGGDELVVLVYNTNPMLFKVDPAPTVEEDVANLAQFHQLARLLGGVVSGALDASARFPQIAADQFVAPNVAAERNVPLDISGRVSKTAFEELQKDELGAILLVISNELHERTKSLPQLITTIKTAHGNLQTQSRNLESATFGVRTYMRAVERERPVDTLLSGLTDLPGLDTNLDTASRTLAAIELPSLSCQASYLAASGALNRKLLGFSAQAAAERVELTKNLALLRPDLTGSDGCSANEKNALNDLKDWLERNDPSIPVTDTQRPMLSGLKSAADDYLELATRLTQVSTTTAELLPKVAAAAKSAEALIVLQDRETNAISAADAGAGPSRARCSLSTGVLQAYRGEPEVPTLKLQKRKFSVKASAPLADDLEKRHKDLDAVEYELDSKFLNDFSFGFGVIKSDLVSPVFSAVQHPTDEKKKVIARTDEESRSGDAALLLSFVPQQRQRFLQWGVDIGAGLDTNTPTALAGLSISFGRFIRLGGGRAWTRVKELSGQKELKFLADGTPDPASLTVVSGKDDIRTRNDFEEDWYFSLTFTLDALPFFRPAS